MYKITIEENIINFYYMLGVFMEYKLRLVSKGSLLLVVLGFFMPVSCNMNGFEIAEMLMPRDNILGLLLYLSFFAAVVGVIIGVYILNKKVTIPFAALPGFVSMLSGIYVYYAVAREGASFQLQTGAYIMFAGWALSLLTDIGSDIFKAIDKIKEQKEE